MVYEFYLNKAFKKTTKTPKNKTKNRQTERSQKKRLRGLRGAGTSVTKRSFFPHWCKLTDAVSKQL